MSGLCMEIVEEQDMYNSPYRVWLFKNDESDVEDDHLMYEYVVQDPSWDHKIPYGRYAVTSAVAFGNLIMPTSPEKVDVQMFATDEFKVGISHRTTEGAAMDNAIVIHVFRPDEADDFIIAYCTLYEHLNTPEFPSAGVMQAMRNDFQSGNSWLNEFLSGCREEVVEKPITVE